MNNISESVNIEYLLNSIYYKKRDIESYEHQLKYTPSPLVLPKFNISNLISHVNSRHDYIAKTVRPMLERTIFDINNSVEKCEHTRNVIKEWYNQEGATCYSWYYIQDKNYEDWKKTMIDLETRIKSKRH